MYWRTSSVSLALVFLVGACGGGGGGESAAQNAAPPGSTASTPSSSAATTTTSDSTAARGSCKVAVTGDVQFQTDVPGRMPADSDYWLSDKELQSAAQVHDDYDARVAKGQQLLQLLELACGDPEGVLIATTDESTRTDIPQAPGTYQVLNYLDKAKPGFAASVEVPGDALFGVTGGTLTVSRFDAKRVAGTFTLEAEELSISVEPGGQPKRLSATGEFDFGCWSPSAPCY